MQIANFQNSLSNQNQFSPFLIRIGGMCWFLKATGEAYRYNWKKASVSLSAVIRQQKISVVAMKYLH
jgi:hypothetical protein